MLSFIYATTLQMRISHRAYIILFLVLRLLTIHIHIPSDENSHISRYAVLLDCPMVLYLTCSDSLSVYPSPSSYRRWFPSSCSLLTNADWIIAL